MVMREQGDTPKAKQGVRFLSQSQGSPGSWGNLVVDLSTYFSNLLNNGNHGYEQAPATRFDFDFPKTIGVDLDWDPAEDGYLYHRDVPSNAEALRGDSGNLEVLNHNGVVFTVPIPDSGRHHILWTKEANPRTTGASDLVRNTLMIYDHVNAEAERHTWLGAAQLGGSARVTLGADASESFPVLSGVRGLWVSRRVQTLTEVLLDDGVETRSAPSSTMVQAHEGLPVQVASGVGEQNEYHGTAAQWALDAYKRARYRTASAVWNERFRHNVLLGNGSHVSNPHYQVALGGRPNNNAYTLYWRTGWWRVFPVPRWASVLAVRLHLQVTNNVPMHVRVYSMNRLPTIGQLGGFGGGDAPPPLDYRFVDITVNDNHAGIGEWYDAGKLRIARGVSEVAEDKTYMVIAYSYNSGSGAGNLRVNAVHAVPGIDTDEGVIPAGGAPFEAG